MTVEDLAARLAGFEAREAPVESIPPEHLPPGGFARAAVLVPLFEKGGVPHVLLTRRPERMTRHAGQVAFPGGRVEPGEETLAAALREAQEEVGLDPSRARVLGRLSETLVLQSAFRLTPWVASVPYPYPYAAAAGEVEELLEVPVAELTREGAHRVEHREVYGLTLDVHFFAVGPHVIWGATGRVLNELLGLWRNA